MYYFLGLKKDSVQTLKRKWTVRVLWCTIFEVKKYRLWKRSVLYTVLYYFLGVKKDNVQPLKNKCTVYCTVLFSRCKGGFWQGRVLCELWKGSVMCTVHCSCTVLYYFLGVKKANVQPLTREGTNASAELALQDSFAKLQEKVNIAWDTDCFNNNIM